MVRSTPQPEFRNRNSHWIDFAQLTAVGVAMLSAWFLVFAPTVERVRDLADARHAALRGFEALQRRVEVLPVFSDQRREAEVGEIECALELLRQTWAKARVAADLEPAFERRPEGLALVIRETPRDRRSP